jgi:hypothetical protein
MGDSKIHDEVTVRDEVQIFARNYLSVTHIVAAAHFAKLSAELEVDETKIFLGPGRFSEDWLLEHNAHVTASILSSVAFLEAAINELYADAFGNQTDQLRELDSRSLDLLARHWAKTKSDRKIGTLEKYQCALKVSGRETFEEGKTPYQNAKSVVALRNALVHYVPESRETASFVNHEIAFVKDLEKRLKGKFPSSPLYRNSGEAFFPARCLSAGCAKWVVKNCLTFTDAFFLRLGVTPIYDGVRLRLTV